MFSFSLRHSVSPYEETLKHDEQARIKARQKEEKVAVGWSGKGAPDERAYADKSAFCSDLSIRTHLTPEGRQAGFKPELGVL